MKPFRLSLLAAGLVVCGLILIGLWLQEEIALVLNGNTHKAGSPRRQARIHLVADGEAYSLQTAERLPANLLQFAGIPLFPGDEIQLDGRPFPPDVQIPEAPTHSLQLRRAYPVTVTSGSTVRTFRSHAATLGQALWEAGFRLRAGDRLRPSPETPLSGPTRARLTPSRAVTIRSAEGSLHLYSAAATVGQALVEAGLPLQGLDYSRPPAKAPLPENGRIRIIRVREHLSIEAEPVPFETVSKPVADLELDQQRIVEPGAFGLNARRVRVRYEDGVEVGRQVEAEYLAQEPQPRVVGYGTKIVPHRLDTGGSTIEYWRALNMYAVSYSPSSAGGSVTRSGLPLAKGVVAVDPNFIPLGTRLYIPGYGEAIAADTGGGVVGRMIDLGYSDSDYVSWHQWVTVYFLWPAPADVAWLVP
jgi:uncharacterized protein YabE (DUF348 family)